MLSTSMRNSSLLFFRTVHMRAPESCFSSEDRVCGPCVCPHGRPLFFLAAKQGGGHAEVLPAHEAQEARE